MTEKSGIYCIYFEGIDGKYYIGCANDISLRTQNHLSALKRGNHHNYKLQKAYNTCGVPSIEVLEYCHIDNLLLKEIEYIAKFDSYHSGFNLTLGGEGGSPGEANPSAKHTLDSYISILKKLAYSDKTYSEISSETGVSVDIIKKISAQKAHTYLSKLYPNEYSLIQAKFAKGRDNSAKSKGIVYPILLSPDKQEYSVTNIHEFAELHGLQYQNLHKVLTGKRISHKGWRCK